jgi:diguanylate cyclase (GGDEF)-like protein/PAS domain S-box-containing protein
MTAYAVWMTTLTACYYALPGLRIVTWTALGLSGVLAIVAGIILNRPARKTPWLLLAAANLSFAAGQLIFLLFTNVLREIVPFPSVADVFYLATYPLYAAGLLIFIRWRASGRDRRSLLDALTLSCGLALLSWVYLILPYVTAPGLAAVQKAFSIGYPLGDVLVIAMLARLLAPGSGGTWAVRLLTLGTIGLLVSDVSFGLIQLYHPPFHNGTLADFGWALFYAAWGAAALHPTMAQLTEPVPVQQAESTPLRLSLLMLAALIAPAVLFVEGLEDGPRDAPVIAVFSAILYLLVLSRLADAVASQRRALGRERALRVAGASFASAVTVEEAASAVRRAVDTLIGPRAEQEAMLAVRDRGTLRAVGAGPGDSAVQLSRLDTMAEAGLSLLAGPKPHLVRVRQLGEGVARDLGVTDSVLLCPLALKDRPSGDPLIGVLAVFGDERSLTTLSGTLEILAGQVALAVERVLLNLEVNRRHSEEYFRTLVHDASDIILIIDDDGKIRYATPSAKTIFGDVSVEGAHLWDLVQRHERDDVIAAFTRMRDHEAQSSEDWRITRRDGTSMELEGRYSDLRDDHTVGGLVLTLRDVTGQRQLERELKHRAFHDSLTGLPNRLLFHDRAAHALARARRNGTTVGVIFVDLDDFKVVNDTMGHNVGDELLIAAGMRLAAVVRESDTVARLGGDEFALLIEDAADGGVAETFAEHIVRAFGEPFTLSAGSVITTATVGVATTDDNSDAGGLVSHADLALYAAKAAGKRQWRRYQPVLSAGMMKRRELQAAIADAVVNSAFTLVYQPIVELASGEIVGFEALVRWPHPRWGMIQPDQFITLAEETGHIVPLGSWVLGQAAADSVRWHRRVPHEKPLYISVNVSARQFRDPGFVDTVRRVLATSGLAPSALLLELTESVLLRRDDRIEADLDELKRIGVRLAIDDFGTGYSSLSYLRELPIDVLKIDKSFVEGIAVSEQRLALVEVIIRIAKTLRLTVMAEGIENEVQRDLLISMGCQFGQGYLLARPVGADQAETLLRMGRSLIPELPRTGTLVRSSLPPGPYEPPGSPALALGPATGDSGRTAGRGREARTTTPRDARSGPAPDR